MPSLYVGLNPKSPKGFNGIPICHSEQSEESLTQTNEIPRRNPSTARRKSLRSAQDATQKLKPELGVALSRNPTERLDVVVI